MEAKHAPLGPESRDNLIQSEIDFSKKFSGGYELLGSVSSPMLVRQEELDEQKLRERQLTRKKAELTSFKIKLHLIKNSQYCSSDNNIHIDVLDKTHKEESELSQRHSRSPNHTNPKQTELKKAQSLNGKKSDEEMNCLEVNPISIGVGHLSQRPDKGQGLLKTD